MRVLETERLIVRPFRKSEVYDVHREIYATADVWGSKTREQVADSVAKARMMDESADDGLGSKRAAVLKDSGEFLGQVRLSPSANYFYRWGEDPDPPFNAVEVELAFALGKRFWGQSYAFDASQAMIRFAFEELRLPRLVNGTGDENVRSIAFTCRRRTCA